MQVKYNSNPEKSSLPMLLTAAGLTAAALCFSALTGWRWHLSWLLLLWMALDWRPEGFGLLQCMVLTEAADRGVNCTAAACTSLHTHASTQGQQTTAGVDSHKPG